MNEEREGGKCSHCGEPAKERTCSTCGLSAWIIDCGHYPQPRPIAVGRTGGLELHRDFCSACADLFEEEKEEDFAPIGCRTE
jgi:hypothetical protein